MWHPIWYSLSSLRKTETNNNHKRPPYMVFKKITLNEANWITLSDSIPKKKWDGKIFYHLESINKTKFLLQTISLKEILQQNLILSTTCFSKGKTKKKTNFLLQDDSLQINFQSNQIFFLQIFPLQINSNITDVSVSPICLNLDSALINQGVWYAIKQKTNKNH